MNREHDTIKTNSENGLTDTADFRQLGRLVSPRPALRYYGGKFRMADWIISYFPKHDCYLEPCFGAGSILFGKPKAKVETINDLDKNVVNFFRQLRDNRDELVEKIKYTPWARQEATLPIEGNDIERARIFWAKSWMTIAQKESNPSFRVSKKGSAQPAKIMCEIDYLKIVADRLRGVQIESMDALEFIERYDSENALIYFDPPYLKATRSHADEYAVEMGEEQHKEAAKLLNSCKAKVIVSGYRHELYDEIYEGWKRIDKKFLANSQQTKMESLWLSPNIEPATFFGATG
jgi:DNA adenine methylase